MRLKLRATFLLWLLLPYAHTALAAMPAAELIPAQVAQPAPHGAINLLLILTFFIHIVLVNIVLGSSIIALFKAWRASPFDSYKLKGDTGFATGALALAVNFGVAAFLFAQVAYGSFIYTGIVLMSAWWLAVPLMVMLAYYAFYIIKASGPGQHARSRASIVANSLLLMLVAFLLVTHSSLAIRPDAWPGWLASPDGTMLNLADPTLTPRYLHVIAASVALGGLFMALRARWSLRRPGSKQPEAETKAAASVKYGLKLFVYASLLQALAGLWYLVALPADLRAMLLGGSALATGALALALLLLAVALWTARTGSLRSTSALTLGIIFIMVLLRDFIRKISLAPYSEAGASQSAELALPIASGQGFAFAVFILCALLGAAMIVWMLRVALKTFNGAGD